MNTLIEVKAALEAQQKTWKKADWNNYGNSEYDAKPSFRDAIDTDFLEENDVTDHVTNIEIMEDAMEMRSEYLLETLIHHGL